MQADSAAMPLEASNIDPSTDERESTVSRSFLICAGCERPLPVFELHVVRVCCSECEEITKRVAEALEAAKPSQREASKLRRRVKVRLNVRAFRNRQLAKKLAPERQARDEAACNQFSKKAITSRGQSGPIRHSARDASWLGELRPAVEVDIRAVPLPPPGIFNDRVIAKRRKPKEEVRYCSREDCGRPLNLGRYKTKGDVCRKCREADEKRAREATAIPEEWGVESEDEIRRQLEETRSMEELDAELDAEDEDDE